MLVFDDVAIVMDAGAYTGVVAVVGFVHVVVDDACCYFR